MRKLFLAFGLFLTSVVSAQSTDEAAILQVLEQQTASWNKGDLNEFMKGYWQNDSLMFIGRSGISYGWTNALNNYKKGYPDTAAMGKLSFNIVLVKPLSPEFIHVVGKWNLERSIGNLNGHFTLLFRKIDGQWWIISDHSS